MGNGKSFNTGEALGREENNRARDLERRIDELGREVPDPRPVEWPVGLRRPLSIQEEIQRFVRVEMSRRAEEHGFESFAEADDFDVDDDDDYVSPYELTEMQEERPPEEPVLPLGAPGAPAKPAGGSPAVVQKPPETGTVEPAGPVQEGRRAQ